MAGGYLLKRILLTPEDAAGAIQTNPVCVEFQSESFDLKEDQASEEINLLGTGGDASPMSFGTSTFTGSIGLVSSIDNMVVVFTHVLGTALTSADATADDWTADTVYAAGDIVNTVTDTKHSLICTSVTGTAKSHATTEPVLEVNPLDDKNAKVVDNDVTWVAMPILLTATFERIQQMPSFSIEYELEDASANKFYRRFSGVRMNTMPLSMTGGTISLKIAIDAVGISGIDSLSTDWDEELSAKTGAKIIPTSCKSG